MSHKSIRRTIRTEVLKAVYAQKTSDEEPEKVFDNLLKELFEELKSKAKEKKSGFEQTDASFLRSLFHGVINYEAEFDKRIQNNIVNWEVDRIALIDRIAMHMAQYEFLHCPFIPIRASLNEYIEISKEYSSPKSGKFINGVLDKILTELKRNNKIEKIGRGQKVGSKNKTKR